MPPNAAPPAPSPAAMAIFESGQQTHRLAWRNVETPDGSVYRIFTAQPVAPAPAQGYPVLYMLDGNAAFDSLTAEMLAMVPGLVLAGAGYDTPLRFDSKARGRDYTPSPNGCGVVIDPSSGRMTGGADLFIERLCGVLRGEIERDIKVDPQRRSLWGHSLGGLLALYTLLARPGAFARIASASPAIWWGDEWLLRLEETTSLPDDLKAEILVMLGDSERRSGNAEPHWNGPAPHTLAMAERLRARPCLDVSLRIFEGLGHAQSLVASLPRALEFAAR